MVLRNRFKGKLGALWIRNKMFGHVRSDPVDFRNYRLWQKKTGKRLSTVCGKKIGKKLLREVFSKFFGNAGAPMHKTKNRGHQDLSVVKFSARCDAWSSKKRKKRKLRKRSKYL